MSGHVAIGYRSPYVSHPANVTRNRQSVSQLFIFQVENGDVSFFHAKLSSPNSANQNHVRKYYLGYLLICRDSEHYLVSMGSNLIDYANFKGTGGGSRVIFLVLKYVKIWDSGSQELFTEAKNLALVLRTDSSKLGPRRTFFLHFPFFV